MKTFLNFSWPSLLVLLLLGAFLYGRQGAIRACADGASRESFVGFVEACRARGGDTRARTWSKPPTMVCEVTSQVTP